MSELNNEVAIITGAGSGVGKGIALELGSRGISVVVTDIDDDAGQTTAAAITAAGGNAAFVHADVRDATELQEVLRVATSTFGPVTITVANVMGAGAGGKVWEHDLSVTRGLFDVLVYGSFVTVHTFGPALIETSAQGKPARLLIVGSEHSLGVPPHVVPVSAYTISKYATLGLVDTARRDFEGTGVTVTLVTPSWVRTEKVQELLSGNSEIAQAIEPYVQDTDEVARLAVEGLLRGDYIVATNPVIRQFAIDHAREVMAAVQMLPAVEVPDHIHDGGGDSSKCPVVGL
ncbi:SDR family NAD(P)-dependent oxidoreductase [Nocardia fluminea]|uniref:SDR family NAD(P)-dependent oxidoreductase n=1 Tax=Nocardia fluminea TaxID=134984 RepID=UPI00341A5E37